MAAATAMLDVTYTIPSWAGSGVPPGGEPFNVIGGLYNVLIIGAGNINFGSGAGPWNHSFRIEHKLGPRLKIVGLVDPFVERSAAVLAKKRASFVASAYNETGIYKTPEDFSEDVKKNQSLKPRFIVVGCPPAFRGSDEPGKDLEIRLLKLFPGTPLFVEKPVSSGDIGRAFTVSRAINDSKIHCSVGYMLRYLKAVQEMKKIIRENKLTVMATIARYACAYESIITPDWWNKALSGGPVIEQGTHFCDLSRYFAGDVDISSIQATSIEWDEDVGKLSKIGFDENTISPENRIPRVTMANWKYENGAVGSLTHLATLQGAAYACEIEVYCDGYLLKLIDPYNRPVLHVRRPGSDTDEIYNFEGDDPFFSEISAFVDVIEQNPNAPQILSSFEDACKSYELTWAIRLASEKNRAHRNEDSYRRKEDLGM